MSDGNIDAKRVDIFFEKVLSLGFRGDVKGTEKNGSSGVSTTECVSI